MRLQENIPLLPFNTFAIDCETRYFVAIDKPQDLHTLRNTSEFVNNERLVLGGGSNLLFTNNFNGIVIKNDLKGFDIIDEDEEYVWLNVMGGENWHELVTHCVDRGWGGIENLALIPGCVGAAPIQNIGAYGVELKDVFVSLEAFMWDSGDIRAFFKKDCAFEYRNSIFKNELKNRAMVLSVTLKLSKTPEVDISYGAIAAVLREKGIKHIRIKDVYETVIGIRRSKLPDPAEIGNAGSFFKNPELPAAQARAILEKYPKAPHYIVSDDIIKIPAGWMIEHCGWKGHRRGDIGVHEQQALVLVNYGKGSGDSLRKLAEEIRKSVLDEFGVELTPEVNIID